MPGASSARPAIATAVRLHFDARDARAHIRRERATSNICTNHSLCALAVTVYLSLMASRAARLAERNVELAHQAADALLAAGVERRFTGPFFNELRQRSRGPQRCSNTRRTKKSWRTEFEYRLS